MDWGDIGQQLAPIAPTLGRLLGSALPIPFGGTLGQVAGEAVASALGVAGEPGIVAQTIAGTPQDVLKAQLAGAEQEAAAKFQALAEAAKAEGQVGSAQVTAVAATQQAELVNGTWYQRWWRPAIMFLWAATLPFQAYELLINLHAADPARLVALGPVMIALTTWNGPWAAVAGIYSWNRSQEKIAALANGH